MNWDGWDRWDGWMDVHAHLHLIFVLGISKICGLWMCMDAFRRLCVCAHGVCVSIVLDIYIYIYICTYIFYLPEKTCLRQQEQKNPELVLCFQIPLHLNFHLQVNRSATEITEIKASCAPNKLSKNNKQTNRHAPESTSARALPSSLF